MSISEHLALQSDVWRQSFRSVWARRHALLKLSIALWVPWRILVAHLNSFTGFEQEYLLPLSLVLDPLFELYFAGAVLVLVSQPPDFPWHRALMRALWLAPRFWLIDVKIALFGLALPFASLYAGAALVSTVNASQAGAYVVLATVLTSFVWTIYVLVRYLLAHVLIVAERNGGEWKLWGTSFVDGLCLWLGSCGVSTGWSLRSARRLIRRRLLDAVLLIVTGQAALSLVLLPVPDPSGGLLFQIVSGAAMFVTTVWWALLWHFGRECLSHAASEITPQTEPAPAA